MTNEEKALYLSQKYGAPKNKNREIAIYQSTIEMAEWKDDIIKSTIKKEIDRANGYYDKKLSTRQITASLRVIQVLSDLIGEKFPYDKLHMNFATMDLTL